MDIRVEVDVHRQFESLDRLFFNCLAEANSMVVNQDMNWPVVLRDLLPQLLRSRNISKISLVEMHVLEVHVASQGFDVLEELCLEVASDVNDNKIDASELAPTDELLSEEFAKALGATRDHDVRTPF